MTLAWTAARDALTAAAANAGQTDRARVELPWRATPVAGARQHG